jgi:hypothetical protein
LGGGVTGIVDSYIATTLGHTHPGPPPSRGREEKNKPFGKIKLGEAHDLAVEK